MILTRDDILRANDSQMEAVDVPEWGGQVLVKGLSGTERDRFEQDSIDQRGKTTKLNFTNIRARLLVLCLVDEQGNRLFQRSDIDMLGQKSAAALNRVFEVARRLSGLNQEDVEELAENFDDGQSDNSTSD